LSAASQTEFQTDWQAYRSWVGTQASEAGKSSMWQAMIRDFVSRRDAPDWTQLMSPEQNRAYGLLGREWERAGFGVRRWLLGATYLVARGLSFARARVWAVNASGMGVRHLVYSPAGLRWLRQLGLFPGYQAFCERFRVSLHNSNAIKSFYVASTVASLVSNDGIRSPRMLEVGGGLGVLASMLRQLAAPPLYVIVDLPEMLLQSSLQIKTLFPDAKATFLYAEKKVPSAMEGFVFCTPERIHDLPGSDFDVAFNIDSFQEMNAVQVASYVALAQRALRHGGLFLNLNRRKHLDAEGFDNNPLLYPYFPGNQVLRWETDLFMDRVFNYDRARLDGWLLRVERIVKS
jgi:hypothetical protein